MTEQTSAPEATLKPRQRQELRAVIKNDFKVLREELTHKANILSNEAERVVKEEMAVTLKKCPEILIEEQKIIAECNKALADLQAKAAEMGIVPKQSYSSSNAFLTASTSNHSWVPDGLKEKVQGFRNALYSEKSRAELELNRKEADVLRELTLDGLPESDAKRFLDSVPKVAELLPSSVRFAGIIDTPSMEAP